MFYGALRVVCLPCSRHDNAARHDVVQFSRQQGRDKVVDRSNPLCFVLRNCTDNEVARVLTDESEQRQADLGQTNSIHVNALRILVSNLIPQVAGLAPEPEKWLAEFRLLNLSSADYIMFPASGGIGSDMMKAAVLCSLEETFDGAQKILRICNLSSPSVGEESH